MNPIAFKNFDREEHETWKTLYALQQQSREQWIVPEFRKGLEALGITGHGIPHLDEVNKSLFEISGFRAVPVNGYEETDVFFQRLARREFPIGNFIRDRSQLSYTPAPDVFHDLYGHVPFLAWPQYADFCASFGTFAMRFRNDPKCLQQCDRFFWFSVEFGLIKGPRGRMIFGAGIASSIEECRYALSDVPKVSPFDIEAMRHCDFKIDELQPHLFLLNDAHQLFNCMPDLQLLISRQTD